ncbi:unnamed protein product, partial [Discosporangium mesarthrocarpum]
QGVFLHGCGLRRVPLQLPWVRTIRRDGFPSCHQEGHPSVVRDVAVSHPVDMLVLDRTFSSLSACAMRLMGPWTKWAIWGFTGWEADVTADYLACRCYKA